MANRDPATNQLLKYRETAKLLGNLTTATTSGGAPLVNKDRTQTVGPRGPIPLSDVQFVEEISHFVRERIPERVLHAKGSGAFGFFESSADNSHLTMAKVFHFGKRTPVVVRFSTTVGELGSAEAPARDQKGMSVKFQTEDGVLDLSGNHTPTFFLRDPILFPSLVHAVKRNPKTHLPDPNMFWDFMSLRPETMATLLRLFSNTGIPDGWRRMDSYPANVYKLVNSNGVVHYCKFAFECKETKRHLTTKEASQVEPDYFTRDLFNAIERHNYPSWILYMQVMTERQGMELLTRRVYPFDPFDNTKIWPLNEFPRIRLGSLSLTTNPTNHFAEIEQLAFAPANMVPGIEPSAYDRILQARIFAYPDAQRYRLGPNYQQLGPNRPLSTNTLSATTAHGTPITDKDATLTAGPRGPVLLQDIPLIEEIAHFDRERIPERVVHAKGAGAFGYFEVTHDITKYSAAKVFSQIGKKTPIAVRFSTVGGESGSADTVRDPRGFAVKFYTEDGIWDLVGNNTPIFFIRDPVLFPSFIHTQKRNPQTHLKDPDMFWDFITLRPESTHQTMILFSDRGIPDGYRHMNGYGSHTFKLVNAEGQWVYCKFHYKTNQGIKNLDVKKAGELSGSDPDYSIRDLYNAIAKGDYPSWTFYIQVMTNEQAIKCPFNPFDLTKVWSHSEYPLIPVGKLVLNKNPQNYFAEVEQVAFSPAHMVPGIEPSPDKMLLGRLFSYGDTHRHRLGPNYLQLPVNCPFRIANYQRDGQQAIHNQGGAPNYHPNSFGGPTNNAEAKILSTVFSVGGDAKRYDTGDEDNFSQATVFYRKTLTKEQQDRLVNNIVGNLKDAADFIQLRAVKNFSQVDASLGEKIAEGLKIQKKNQASL